MKKIYSSPFTFWGYLGHLGVLGLDQNVVKVKGSGINTFCWVFLKKETSCKRVFLDRKLQFLKNKFGLSPRNSEKSNQKRMYCKKILMRARSHSSAWWQKWSREGTKERQQSLAQPERAGEIARVPACHMVSRQAAEQDRWMKKWTQEHHKDRLAQTQKKSSLPWTDLF